MNDKQVLQKIIEKEYIAKDKAKYMYKIYQRNPKAFDGFGDFLMVQHYLSKKHFDTIIAEIAQGSTPSPPETGMGDSFFHKETKTLPPINVEKMEEMGNSFFNSPEETTKSLPSTNKDIGDPSERKKNLALENIPESIPNQIPGFEIIEKLGEGGMGVVYKALQKDINRVVALKVIIPQELDEQSKKRFLKEIQTSIELEHKNIVRVYSAGEHRSYPYLVMRYIEGKPLNKYIKNKHLTETEILRIIVEVLDGLSYLEKKKLIHRDIKPDNILVANDGCPYICDFGLMRSTTVEDFRLTKTGTVLGTPSYVSPEQAVGNRRQIDFRTDIYSLGVILYQIFTKELPIKGDSITELLNNLFESTPVPPRQINDEISPTLEAIILKAIAFDKEKRYRSREMKKDIERYLAGENFGWEQKYLLQLRQLYRLRKVIVIMLMISTVLAVIFQYSRSNTEREKVDKIVKRASEIAEEEVRVLSRTETADSLREKLSTWDQAKVRLALDQVYRTNDHLNYSLLEFMGLRSLEIEDYLGAQRYLEAANRAKVKTQEITPSRILQKIALLRVFFGDNRGGAKIYQRLLRDSNATVVIEYASLQYRLGQYQSARTTLQQLKSKDEEILFKKYFIDAMCLWNLQRIQLNTWEWLAHEANENRIKLGVHRQLKRVATSFENSLALVKNITVRDSLATQVFLQTFWENRQATPEILTEVIQHFLTSVKYEAKPVGKIVSEEKFVLKSLFWHEFLIRQYVARENWLRVFQLSSQGIEKYPWDSNFYTLRAIAQTKLDLNSDEVDLDDARRDVIRAVRIERWNIFPMENMISLFFQNRFAHQEGKTYSDTLSQVGYILKDQKNIPRDILALHWQKIYQQSFTAKFSVREEDWGILPRLLRELPQAEITKIVLRNCFFASSKKTERVLLESGIRNKFAKDIEKWQQDLRLDQFQKLLLRYSVLEEERYLKEIYHDFSLDFFKKILRGDTEVELPTKWLTTKAFIKITASQLNKKNSLADLNLTDFSNSLLFYLALESFKNDSSLTKKVVRIRNEFAQGMGYKSYLNLQRELSQQDLFSLESFTEKNFSDEESFLGTLVALYLPANNYVYDVVLHQLLLFKEEPVVNLAAAFNWQGYYQQTRRLNQVVVDRQLRKIFTEAVTDQEKALAFRLIWGIEHRNIQVKRPELRQRALFAESRKLWQDQKKYDILEQVLFSNSTNLKLRLLALIHLAQEEAILKGASHAKREEVLRKMNELYDRSKHFEVQYWAAFILAHYGSSEECKENILRIVNNTYAPAMVRCGATVGLLENKKTQPLVFSMLRKLIGKINKNSTKAFADQQSSDLIRIQLTLLVIARGAHKKKRQRAFVRTLMFNPKFFTHPQREIRQAFITCQMWIGTQNEVAKLKQKIQTLQDSPRQEDRYTLRASAASLASLLGESNTWYSPFLKLDTISKKTAALGYYSSIQETVGNRHIKILAGDEREIYLEEFGRRITNPLVAQKWLTLLNYATQLHPKRDWIYEKALILFSQQKFQQVKQLLNPLVGNHNSQREIDYTRSRVLTLLATVENNHERKLKLLKQALEENPFYLRAHEMIKDLK